jgi:hypothetical protein
MEVQECTAVVIWGGCHGEASGRCTRRRYAPGLVVGIASGFEWHHLL